MKNIQKLTPDNKYYETISYLLENEIRVLRSWLSEDGLMYSGKDLSTDDVRIDEDLNVYAVDCYNTYDVKYEKVQEPNLYEKTSKVEELISEIPIYTKVDICKGILDDYRNNEEYYANDYSMKEMVAEAENYLSELSNRN